jgi:hypothetical protein
MARRVFLERRTYRKNRLQDAARLLPVLGMILFFGPVFISDGQAEGRGGHRPGGLAGLLLSSSGSADRDDGAGQPRVGGERDGRPGARARRPGALRC